jgi:hypothetical protein
VSERSISRERVFRFVALFAGRHSKSGYQESGGEFVRVVRHV